MSYIVPIGPYHPALEEPVHARLYTDGEQITDAEVAMTMQEGVGEIAYWYESRTQLLVYANGYALDVAVVCSDTPLTEPYVRQIAQLMLSVIQPVSE